MKMNLKIKTISAGLFLCLGLMFWNCSNPANPGGQVADVPPVARLSNIPPTDTVITTPNPRLSLYWVGDDPDGFVVGYKYYWSYTINGAVFRHQYARLLNIQIGGFALMCDSATTTDTMMVNAYHYFSTLPPEGIAAAQGDSLAAGDTIGVNGVRVFASNPENVSFPIHINPTSGTFIFDSQDSLNNHTFYVAAIDNQGQAGKPAKVTFITPRVSSPTTEIVGVPSDTVLVNDHVTVTFTGVQFQFAAYDANSRTVQYSYNLDSLKDPITHKLKWSPFSFSPIARITAADFAVDTARRHVISVRSMNEFGSIDTLGIFYRPNPAKPTGFDTIYAHQVFYTIFPEFLRGGQHRILVYNASFGWDTSGFASVVRPSTAMLNKYYDSLMTAVGKPYGIASKYQGAPSLTLLSRFSTVILVGDVVTDKNFFPQPNYKYDKDQTVFNGDVQATLQEYAYIGGNFITSCANMNFGINTTLGGPLFPLVFHAQQNGGPFICLTDSTGLELNNYNDTTDFIGAQGLLGYPDITLNPAKLDPSWRGGIRRIYYTLPLGFGEYLYNFKSDWPLSCFDGKNIGVRYQGITFNSVFLGFPLYYVPLNQATAVVKQALIDCGE